ncbi:hypothetical protein [Pengzhenrongella sp.]|jgi:hypothetical protein|uniref:hypothetical protein n=1 Tax=Pengzhenrongella sp. TaxID=2888820 RepID=UPI002F938DAD
MGLMLVLLGAITAGLAGVVAARANPNTPVRFWGHPPVRPWSYWILFWLYIGAIVVGTSELRQQIGFWLSLLVAMLASVVPFYATQVLIRRGRRSRRVVTRDPEN